MILLAVVQAVTVSHEFVYRADKAVQSVNVAGTFNNWDRGANALKVDADGMTWRLTLPLPIGKHHYKFVLNGEQWITDPKAAHNEDDGNGNTNSVLLMLPADYSKPARRGDSVIAESALQHLTNAPSFNFDRGRLTFTFRTRAGDVNGVDLVLNGRALSMTRRGGDDLYETYRAAVPWNQKVNLEYVFRVRDGRTVRFGPDGANGQKSYRIEAASFHPFATPTWAEGRVFYQIFPERFANGDPSNDPKGTVAWGSKPEYFNYMGGDLAGVRQHADYLFKLGVGGVYFNPIFEGPSNHGYETTDYLKVSPRLGTNSDFARLVDTFHQKDVKVVLDGVFNHTSTSFKAFADIREKGNDSSYANWYWVKSYPVVVNDPPNYTAWFNFPSMPKVNLSTPAARSYFLSIPKFWHDQAHIDGWRLDVANEVQMDYWRDFRRAVTSLDPNGWIVGEIWGDGTPWLGGDQYDSVMGYQFRDAVLGYVAEGKTKPSAFLDRLMKVYDSYAPQVSRNLMNLLSSHDTPRFLTLCHGDQKLALLGAALQLTWPGTPSIYYGEEIGMEGGPDPANRAGMEWNRATDSNPFLATYRKLIALRKESKALQVGDPVALATDDAHNTLAYARVFGRDVAIVIVNRSNDDQEISIPLDSIKQETADFSFNDELGHASVRRQAGSLTASLSPRSAAVLLPTRGAHDSTVRDAHAVSARRLAIKYHSLRRD